MKGKRFKADQIIRMLREAELLRSGGMLVPDVCRQLDISLNTYHRWRKVYGGMDVNQARRLKELERENARLKKLVADLMLDNTILKEVTSGKY